MKTTFNHRVFLWAILSAAVFTLSAQEGQVIRGTVTDQDTNEPLIGATIVIAHSDPLIGGTTDTGGAFTLTGVPLGRHDINVSYMGYTPIIISDIMVTSGKRYS